MSPNLISRAALKGKRHTERADLIVEISESSLTKDRRAKGKLYAQFSQPEYWILNLKHTRLEVRRQPIESEYGFAYEDLMVLSPGQTIAPLFAPDRVFEVSQLLGA